MSLDRFYLKQLSDQDKALDKRKAASSAGSTATISKQLQATNQTLITASDGSAIPAIDNSSSQARTGKSIAFDSASGGASAQVNTKIGRA